MIGVRGAGSCIPGPCLPHGSIHPSPDTWPAGNSGYRRGGGKGIVGFSQLHAQGTGGDKSYGNFLVSPQIGLKVTEADRASDVADETARVDCYRVRLAKYDIQCEVTPTAHAALYRFTFPQSDEATIAIDVGRKLDSSTGMDDGEIRIDPQRGIITGGGQFSHNWNPAAYHCFFVGQVNRLPEKTGVWIDRAIDGDRSTAAAKQKPLGGYLQWKTSPGEVIELKIAVSF
ncbi:MAG TPA: hypothetical protein VGJ15_10120, partial [Pirellulales bacterium]